MFQIINLSIYYIFTTYYYRSANPNELSNPVIVAIAKKHNKTPAQVILRWNIQRHICAIPKSTNKKRILENFDVFDFKLEEDEMEKIYTLNTNARMYDGSYNLKGACDPAELWK